LCNLAVTNDTETLQQRYTNLTVTPKKVWLKQKEVEMRYKVIFYLVNHFYRE
jgi:hypothetical protein